MNKKLAFATTGIMLLLVNTIFELLPNSLLTALIVFIYLLFCGLQELDSSDLRRKNVFLQRKVRNLEDKLEIQETEIRFLRKKLDREMKFHDKIHDALNNKKVSNS